MGWFPTAKNDQNGWQFDILTLLAILGESIMEKHVLPITASSFAALPRLLPAPQTALSTERRYRLPSVPDVVVAGVHSGSYFTELNYFADVLHNVRSLQPYEFRVYEVSYSENNSSKGSQGWWSRGSSFFGKGDGDDHTQPRDVETPAYAMTFAPTLPPEEINLPVKPFSPLNLVTYVSVLITLGLFIASIILHDGVSALALVTMSISTSLGCLSSQWRPMLTRRPVSSDVPPGDVVINTRAGAFVVVKCDEEITRELYGGVQTCNYVFSRWAHRVLLGFSTVLLMASVLLFSNCKWTMQAATAVTYIVLNIMYWAIPMVMHERDTWDMSRYNFRRCLDREPGYTKEPSYTQTLWYAIRETREIGWVEHAKLAPNSPYWKMWLQEAKENIDNEDWDPVEAKNTLMREARRVALISRANTVTTGPP